MKLSALDNKNCVEPWHMIISEELTSSDFIAVASSSKDSCMLSETEVYLVDKTDEGTVFLILGLKYQEHAFNSRFESASGKNTFIMEILQKWLIFLVLKKLLTIKTVGA